LAQLKHSDGEERAQIGVTLLTHQNGPRKRNAEDGAKCPLLRGLNTKRPNGDGPETVRLEVRLQRELQNGVGRRLSELAKVSGCVSNE